MRGYLWEASGILERIPILPFMPPWVRAILIAARAHRFIGDRELLEVLEELQRRSPAGAGWLEPIATKLGAQGFTHPPGAVKEQDCGYVPQRGPYNSGHNCGVFGLYTTTQFDGNFNTQQYTGTGYRYWLRGNIVGPPHPTYGANYVSAYTAQRWFYPAASGAIKPVTYGNSPALSLPTRPVTEWLPIGDPLTRPGQPMPYPVARPLRGPRRRIGRNPWRVGTEQPQHGPAPVLRVPPRRELVIEGPVVRERIDTHRNAPPVRPHREIKVKSGILAVTKLLLDVLSEGAEFIESIYDALPKDRQIKDASALEQLVLAMKYWNEIDPGEAVKNLVTNEIEDRLLGRFHRLAPRTGGNPSDRPPLWWGPAL